MNKLFGFILVLVSTFSISASACEGEAQIIAKVSHVVTDSMTFCRAFVDVTSVKHYAESYACPLALSEVLRQGIDFPLENGHECNVQVGDVINGILIKEIEKITLF